jgi:predicted GIY-YIG superfamily endonuclease
MINTLMKDKKYHFVYITRHKNGKYYVGRHSTDDLNDGYIGSGTGRYLSRIGHH